MTAPGMKVQSGGADKPVRTIARAIEETTGRNLDWFFEAVSWVVSQAVGAVEYVLIGIHPLVIIAVLTAAFIASAVSGVEKGIQGVSRFRMGSRPRLASRQNPG